MGELVENIIGYGLLGLYASCLVGGIITVIVNKIKNKKSTER